MPDGYEAFDVKQLYTMVEAAQRGLGPTQQQIEAWRRTNQMLDGHAAALQRYRDELATRWPPETNAASAAYLGELDRLLRAVEQTSRASTANASQTEYVAGAIKQAHAALKPIYDEYVSNEGKLARYEATVQAAGIGGRVTHGPVGEVVAEGAMKLFTSPPVDDGRQEQLLRDARQAMRPLSGAAQDAIWNLQPPPEYIPPQGNVEDDPTPFGGESTGGAIRPPVIDSPRPGHASMGPDNGMPAGSGPDSPSGLPPGSGSGVAPVTGSPPGTGPASTSPVIPGSGPVLSGVAPSPTLPAQSVISPEPLPAASGQVGVPPTAGAAGAAAPLRTFGTPGGIGGVPGAIGGVPGAIGGVPGAIGGVPGAVVGGGRPLPTGAVIGGQPGRPMGGTDAGIQRVNPVGGVIGGAAGGRGPTPGPTGMGAGVLGPARAGGRTDRQEGRRWDPEDPWEVDEGVTPIIEPDRRQGRHDPGRGVIGIDR